MSFWEVGSGFTQNGEIPQLLELIFAQPVAKLLDPIKQDGVWADNQHPAIGEIDQWPVPQQGGDEGNRLKGLA